MMRRIAATAILLAACSARGVNLMEAVMYRYTDRTRQVVDVLRSGALGEIKHISATFRFLLANPASIKLKPELGGGALYDVYRLQPPYSDNLNDLMNTEEFRQAVPEVVERAESDQATPPLPRIWPWTTRASMSASPASPRLR